MAVAGIRSNLKSSPKSKSKYLDVYMTFEPSFLSSGSGVFPRLDALVPVAFAGGGFGVGGGFTCAAGGGFAV
eukprot:2454788-Amphidinium_carterae.3